MCILVIKSQRHESLRNQETSHFPQQHEVKKMRKEKPQRIVRKLAYYYFFLQVTIKKTLQDFKRTHQDNWQDHKLKFSDDQLAVLTDLLVSPSYYA